MTRNIIPLALFFAIASAARADTEGFMRCARDYPGNDAERLKCYDDAALAPHPAVQSEASGTPGVLAEAPPGQDAMSPGSAAGNRSYFTRVWDLDNRKGSSRSALDRLQPHQQSYLLIQKSSNINNQPSSPAIGRTAATPYDLDAAEAKFQLSFKTDFLTQQNIDLWGMKTLRVWGAYTQQSYWQVFNTRNSSPFRETDYEPEMIATFGTGNEAGWKLLNLGLLHQSNGRSNPDSRSWNRVYAQGGWEWGGWSLLGRGWWRIPESAVKDDNPDITHYMGYGDLVLRWQPEDNSQSVALLLRNNLSMSQNLGYLQLDWTLPVDLGRAARLHAQFSNGYGESLIDYNHRQTTLGLGISFREW
jgi:phospholipase A1/A2